MRHLKIIAPLVLASLLAGCASQRVDWDYDNANGVQEQMLSWKTYAWLPVEPEQMLPYHLDGLQDRRIRSAVNQQLQAKSYQQVAADKADFLVNYLTTSKTRREENHITTSMGYGMRSWGMGVYTETRVNDYEEGGLLIDVIDPQDHELLWRGRSRARLSDTSTPEKRTEKTNKAVTAILEAFPSRPEN